MILVLLLIGVFEIEGVRFRSSSISEPTWQCDQIAQEYENASYITKYGFPGCQSYKSSIAEYGVDAESDWNAGEACASAAEAACQSETNPFTHMKYTNGIVVGSSSCNGVNYISIGCFSGVNILHSTTTMPIHDGCVSAHFGAMIKSNEQWSHYYSSNCNTLATQACTDKNNSPSFGWVMQIGVNEYTIGCAKYTYSEEGNLGQIKGSTGNSFLSSKDALMCNSYYADWRFRDEETNLPPNMNAPQCRQLLSAVCQTKESATKAIASAGQTSLNVGGFITFDSIPDVLTQWHSEDFDVDIQQVTLYCFNYDKVLHFKMESFTYNPGVEED